MSPFIDDHRAALADLCRQHRVRSLSVFGSAARDDFDPDRSDVDLLVEFAPLAEGEYADAYFGLREASRTCSAARSTSSPSRRSGTHM